MTDQFEAFTAGAEELRADAAELPRLLQESVESVAAFARGVTDLVAELDARRAVLNDWARHRNVPLVPDVLGAVVPRSDATLARLLAAARRGPSDAATALGKAARRPAQEAQPTATPADEFTDTGIDEAAFAAAGLMTALHHNVHDLDAGQLIGDADPFTVSALLAAVALDLAERVVPDVGAWLVEMAAENAATGG